MKNKTQVGLMFVGMMMIGQIKAQAEQNRPNAETKPVPTQDINKQFTKLDANGDGFLVPEEMQKGKGNGAKDQENRFRKIDANQDGRINLEEYRMHESKVENDEVNDDEKEKKDKKPKKEKKSKKEKKGTGGKK